MSDSGCLWTGSLGPLTKLNRKETLTRMFSTWRGSVGRRLQTALPAGGHLATVPAAHLRARAAPQDAHPGSLRGFSQGDPRAECTAEAASVPPSVSRGPGAPEFLGAH